MTDPEAYRANAEIERDTGMLYVEKVNEHFALLLLALGCGNHQDAEAHLDIIKHCTSLAITHMSAAEGIDGPHKAIIDGLHVGKPCIDFMASISLMSYFDRQSQPTQRREITFSN
jgi:hypothetical protein